MAILNEHQMMLTSKLPVGRLLVLIADQVLPVSLLSDAASYTFQYMGKLYILLKDSCFPNGSFDWRHAKNTFFRFFFAYYQEEFIDFEKRPELRGIVTDWLPADQLAKQMKLGDLIEFKGTATGFTLFHVSYFVPSLITIYFIRLRQKFANRIYSFNN
jgi:hypothetical protein